MRFSLFLISMLTFVNISAQAIEDVELDFGTLLDSSRELIESKLDEDLVKKLGALGDEQGSEVTRLVELLQRELQGEYTLELARLKPVATSLLGLLEGNPATGSLAGWLKPRMDYFDAAEELRLNLRQPSSPSNAGEIPKASVSREPEEPTVDPHPAGLHPPDAEKMRLWWLTRMEKQTKPVVTQVERQATRLKPIFSAFGVPEELVWVAEVESSFDPRAVSPVGAAGLFQFMPVTALSQGLELKPRDERHHPEKSARAAASYLRHLHSRFGDWRLALAAYNAGEGRVSGLLSRHSAKSYDAIARHLPAETQMYVPKIEAVIRKRERRKLDQLTPVE